MNSVIEVDVHRDADLSAEAVWEEIRHFDRVLKWVPGGDESHDDGWLNARGRPFHAG